ncbi:hypothetical protein [Bathymodiolus platifrons methanotrophic gill symbiont]|uniref:hypothetical protein n=1 Tax=Bathymodiolus platifrons methanotrophic gill symbiont TaxID=113268 RepID=UPI001C8EDB50|nr:hypothetical protein [Bathymodiolus platifrons methanotrophic gill symbiont]
MSGKDKQVTLLFVLSMQGVALQAYSFHAFFYPYKLSLFIAGSRYFCESLFWASQPKQAAKT